MASHGVIELHRPGLSTATTLKGVTKSLLQLRAGQHAHTLGQHNTLQRVLATIKPHAPTLGRELRACRLRLGQGSARDR